MLETTNPGTTPSHHPINTILQYRDRVVKIIQSTLSAQANEDYSERILLRFLDTLISDSYAVIPRDATYIIHQRIPSNNEFQNILEEIGTQAILSGDSEEFLRTMVKNPHIFMRINYIKKNPLIQEAIRERIQKEEENSWNTDFLGSFLR